MTEAAQTLVRAAGEAALQELNEAVLVLDELGALVDVNPAGARLLGRPAAEVLGRRVEELLAGWPEALSAVEDGQAVVVLRPQAGDGGAMVDRTYALRLSPVRDTANVLIGEVALLRDLTERRLVETALRDSQARFELVMETISDGYYEADLTGVLTYVNGVFYRALGYTREGITGRNFRRFTNRENSRTVFQAFNQVYHTGVNIQRAEYLFIRQDASPLHVELSISARHDQSGRIIGFRGFVRDINDRVAAQAALRESKEAAEAANQAKSTFLTTISHELRTPLTSVLGFAKLIKKRVSEVLLPALDPDDKRLQRASRQVSDNLDIIVSEGERLTALINNLLDLAKIEAGKVEWNMQPVAVGDVITRAVAATRALAEQKQLGLSAEVAEALPLLQADPDRLLQVVINLISNAVKFTPAGAVTLRAWQAPGHVLVSVADTGIGLSEADLGRVFDQFVQVGNTLTDKPVGTGLGLPICKQIVEHHGGRIWAESEAGQGSRFIFQLPAAVAAEAAPAVPAPTEAAAPASVAMDTLLRQLRARLSPAGSQPGRRRVLIVDDDRNIRALLREELETDGYEVQAAANGREALALVKQTPPDLVIMDVMMPELTGFDVAAVLRADPETSRIPIIILSVIPDRERGYRVGVDRYFTKPVDAPALLGAVGELLSQGASQKNVLVVDEDAAVVQTLSDVLRAQGYIVSAAYSGPQGIDLALTARPDLVIVNSLLSEQSRLVQTLRFEKGLDNVAFLLFH